ncbi:MAG: hypothetical protein OEU26_25135 [Candidatus Tectomicrobia bacterium]|nr:hypothetical protein [Candidatus Tectomicrobia bacterium]
MRCKLKTYAIVLGLFTSMSLMSCGDSTVNIDVDDRLPPDRDTDFVAEESFSFDVEVENRSQLRVQGINGDITITGRAGSNSVIITGTRRVGSDSLQDAQEHLQKLEVNVQPFATEVLVQTVQPPLTGGRSYVVNYTITLPNQLAIEVANVNGLVTLDAIDNDVAVNNVNGNVTLMEILGSAQVNLVNGIIDSDVTLPLDGSIDLDIVNGPINLAIPVNTSARFSATVRIGSISVSNLMLPDEISTSTSLSGTLGDGEGTIALETDNGNIRVSGF